MRGYQTMRGYHGLPEATADTIDADGWLHTGDLGTMDGRGFVRIAGRLKDMIIRGGMNLFPREIEDVIFDHPGVAQVSVVGVPDERWGEVVAAVVVPRDAATAPHLRRARGALPEPGWPRTRCPGSWFFVAELPAHAVGQGPEVQTG